MPLGRAAMARRADSSCSSAPAVDGRPASGRGGQGGHSRRWKSRRPPRLANSPSSQRKMKLGAASASASLSPSAALLRLRLAVQADLPCRLPAWPGLAWPTLAWPGWLAWPGLAWPGLAGPAWPGPRSPHCLALLAGSGRARARATRQHARPVRDLAAANPETLTLTLTLTLSLTLTLTLTLTLSLTLTLLWPQS